MKFEAHLHSNIHRRFVGIVATVEAGNFSVINTVMNTLNWL